MAPDDATPDHGPDPTQPPQSAGVHSLWALRGYLRPHTRSLVIMLTTALLGVGLCGGFTSFSTFAVQTVERPVRIATTYVVATTVLSVGACTLGWALGSRLG